MSDRPRHDSRRGLAVQFEDLTKQAHAAHLGMWLFLVSELLLFAGLFALYAGYRTTYASAFADGVHHNSLWIGTTNVVVLIVSSFTVAWAVHMLRAGRRGATLWALLVTIVLGVAFLVFKSIEYGIHFSDGVFPGQHYSYAALPGHGAQLFFTLYYFMTGLHALHMIGGLVAITWIALRVRRRKTTQARHVDLELGALYWHLVDSIWIFLWPLFYLTTG